MRRMLARPSKGHKLEADIIMMLRNLSLLASVRRGDLVRPDLVAGRFRSEARADHRGFDSGHADGALERRAMPARGRPSFPWTRNNRCCRPFRLRAARSSSAPSPSTAAKPANGAADGTRSSIFRPAHPRVRGRFLRSFHPKNARVRSIGDRVEVSFDGMRMGIFEGSLRYVFYPGSRLIEQQAAMTTAEPDVAYFYDAGLRMSSRADETAGGNMNSHVSYFDTRGNSSRPSLPLMARSGAP